MIRDGVAAVWESHTILRYLAARYGEQRFWSDDPGARARVEGWMDCRRPRCSPISWSACSGDLFAPRPSSGTGMRTNAALAPTMFDLPKLDHLLEAGRSCSGETLSLADITAGTSLYRYFELEIERPSVAGALVPHAAAARACRKQVILPFEELRGCLLDQ